MGVSEAMAPWDTASAGTISLLELCLGLGGGLALFLFGMAELTRSLEATGSAVLRRVLQRLTSSRPRAAITGALATALLQSSTLSTVLLVGFVSAGLVGLPQALAFVLGANLGTTITAQLIAFRIAEYGLAAVGFGFLLSVLGQREWLKHLGAALLGLGLLFHGLDLMSEATSPLRDSERFVGFLRELEQPALGLLAGTLFTAVVQSSSATTGLVIVLAGQGLVSLELGIALVIGANVGTCVTAVIAGLRANPAGKRAALGHLFFNGAGALLWIGFVDDFAALLRGTSEFLPAAPGRELDTARWLAHAHTIFNGANLLLFLPLVGPIAWILKALVPDPKPAARGTAQHLDPNLARSPELATAAASLEIERLGELTAEATNLALAAAISGTRKELEEVLHRERDLDRLHGEIVAFLGRAGAATRTRAEVERVNHLLEVANALESIGDTLERHLVPLGLERIERGVTVSQPTRELLEPLSLEVRAALTGSLEAIKARDGARATAVRAMKSGFRERSASVRTHLARRLSTDAPMRVETFRVESELVEQMRRIFDLSRRLARTVLDMLGESAANQSGEPPREQTAPLAPPPSAHGNA